MPLLVINAGSTTTKFKLFEEDGLTELISGMVDKFNGKPICTLYKNGEKFRWDISDNDYNNPGNLIIKELKGYDISKLGFRIVHGGEAYTKTTLINSESIKKIEEFSNIAPLHNPPAIKRIKEFKELLPDKNFYGVFDTSFHTQMPPKAFLYGLPYEYYQFYNVRRYGFHGISHKYVSTVLQSLEVGAKKIISCHLGGGASICAINDGKSIDTTMGFTPLEGLIMATRAGDVDDGAISYIQNKTKYSDFEMEEIENKKSGLLGISGITSDMRTLLELEKDDNERAHLAIEMYVYRIQKYIGAYIAALDGVDAIIITAGVGCGSDEIRRRIFSGLKYFGLEVDDAVNNNKINVAENLKISTRASKPIWIIPTNEELQIAKEIINL
jgi:acetate kinase